MYQYDIWHMSLYVGDRLVCRYGWNSVPSIPAYQTVTYRYAGMDGHISIHTCIADGHRQVCSYGWNSFPPIAAQQTVTYRYVGMDGTHFHSYLHNRRSPTGMQLWMELISIHTCITDSHLQVCRYGWNSFPSIRA